MTGLRFLFLLPLRSSIIFVQKKAIDDAKKERRMQIIAAEKERAKRVREKAQALARNQAERLTPAVLPSHQHSSRSKAPSSSQASTGSEGRHMVSSSAAFGRNKSVSPAATRRSRVSVGSIDTRHTPTSAPGSSAPRTQSGVPKLSGSYILPRKGEFISLYEEAMHRNGVDESEDGSGLRKSSSTGSPGVEIHTRRRPTDEASDNDYDFDKGDVENTKSGTPRGSDDEQYSDFEDEEGGDGGALKALGKRKRKGVVTRDGIKLRWPQAHQVQEMVGKSTVSQWEEIERQERREMGRKAAEESRRKYLLEKKRISDAEKAAQMKKEKSLKELHRIAEMSRAMSIHSATDKFQRKPLKKKIRASAADSTIGTSPKGSANLKNNTNANKDTLGNIAGWAATGDMFVNRYQNSSSPTIPFPDVLIDDQQIDNSLDRAVRGTERSVLSPPRSEFGLGAAHRYQDDSVYGSGQDIDFAVQRPETRHEDVLISGSSKLSPSRHLSVKGFSVQDESVNAAVSTALQKAINGDVGGPRQLSREPLSRKRPRSAPPARSKKPFVAGSAASIGTTQGSSQMILRSDSIPKKRSDVAYKSVDSLPPPPPPRRNQRKRSGAKDSRKSSRKMASSVNGTEKSPLRTGLTKRGQNVFTEQDLLSLLEEDSSSHLSHPTNTADIDVSDLQRVELAMRESKEAILSLLQLETERLQLERQRIDNTKQNISTGSIDEKSGSDLEAELVDIRASVASLLPAVLARISLEKNESIHDRLNGFRNDDDGVRYSTEGDESGNSLGDHDSDDDKVNMDMDETIAWNPEDRPKPFIRRNSNVSGISFENENYEQEEIELHLADAFEDDGDDFSCDELTDEAGNVYTLSAEAEAYRRSAMQHPSPPPCRAARRSNNPSPESSRGSYRHDKDDTQPSSHHARDYGKMSPTRSHFESNDPVLNAQFGMLQDKRDILAYFGSALQSPSRVRPREKPPGRGRGSSNDVMERNYEDTEECDESDVEGDEFDEDVFGRRHVVRENEFDNREFVSDRYARQGYYDDSDSRLQKSSRLSAGQQGFSGGQLFVVQDGHNKHPLEGSSRPTTAKRDNISAGPSLRNVGQLAGVLNRREHPRGGKLFVDDEEDADGCECDEASASRSDRQSCGYVEGVPYDDARDVSIVSIFARQHLEAREAEKEQARKEKLRAEAKAIAEAVFSANRQKHEQAEKRQSMQPMDDDTHFVGHDHVLGRNTAANASTLDMSDDSEADRDRTFWDALLLRPIHSGSIETSDVPASEFQTSQSEVAETITSADRTQGKTSVRAPEEIIKDLYSNKPRKPSAAELSMQLMDAIKHHEQVVAYEAELGELQHAQSMQIAAQMMKNTSTQAESEVLRMKFEQEAVLQQQAYELSLAEALRSQQEIEREAAKRQRAEWEEMQRRVLRHNDMMDRAHFEADAAQAVANIQSTAELMELERVLESQRSRPVFEENSSPTDRRAKKDCETFYEASEDEKRLIDKSAANNIKVKVSGKPSFETDVLGTMYSDDFDDGFEISEENAKATGINSVRKEYSVDETSTDGYLKQLLADHVSPSDAIDTGGKNSDLRAYSGSKGLSLLAEYQQEMDERLRVQEKTFKLRLSLIKNKRDQELDMLQEHVRKEMERGGDPAEIQSKRASDAALVQNAYAEARSELEKERWSINAKACRELRKFHILRSEMLKYEERIANGKHFRSPPRPFKGISENSSSQKNPHDSVNESYASDFIEESLNVRSSPVKGVHDPIRTQLNQSVGSIIEESYEMDQTEDSSEEISDDEYSDAIGPMITQFPRNDRIVRNADLSGSGYDEDFETSDSFAAGENPKVTSSLENVRIVEMDELRARQEAVREKHLQVESLLKVKADELSREREIIRLEEEERELDELLAAASSLDIKNSSDLHAHRKRMRDQARQRIRALSGGLNKLAGPIKKDVPIKTSKPPKAEISRKTGIGKEHQHSKRNGPEDAGSYDDDFEDDFDEIEEDVLEGSIEEDINEISAAAVPEDEEVGRKSLSSVGSTADDDDNYSETFEKSLSHATLRRNRSASQKSFRSQDSDENGYYAESFVSEDGEINRERSLKSLKADSSSISMGQSKDFNLLEDLDSSIERHRHKVSALKRQMEQIQLEKARLSVLQSRQQDRKVLLDEEAQLIKMLENERHKLHIDKEIIRKELSHASPTKNDRNVLERLGESVDALETSTIEEIAVSKARLALDAVEIRNEEVKKESAKVVKDLVQVLEEPMQEELAAFDEQAIVEEDSFASTGGDLSGSDGSGLRAGIGKRTISSVAEKSNTLRSSVSQRVRELEAATLLQKLHRGRVGRRLAAKAKIDTAEARKGLDSNAISGNLVVELEFTSTAEEFVLEDSFASGADSVERSQSDQDDNSMGLEIAETNNLYSALERLKSASEARNELDARLTEKKEKEEMQRKLDASASAGVMSMLLAPAADMNSTAMVFDEEQMKWVEVGDNTVDMDGFESSISSSDNGDSASTNVEEKIDSPDFEQEDNDFALDKSKSLKILSILSPSKPDRGNKMKFDEDKMAWVGGDDVDMIGFESDSQHSETLSEKNVAHKNDKYALPTVEQDLLIEGNSVPEDIDEVDTDADESDNYSESFNDELSNVSEMPSREVEKQIIQSPLSTQSKLMEESPRALSNSIDSYARSHEEISLNDVDELDNNKIDVADATLEKSALSVSAGSEIMDEAADSQSIGSHFLTNADDSQKDDDMLTKSRDDSVDQPNTSLGESGVETVNWANPQQVNSPSLHRIPSIEEVGPDFDDNDEHDDLKSIETAVTAGTMATLESRSVGLSPALLSAPLEGSDEDTSPTPPAEELENEEYSIAEYSLPSEESVEGKVVFNDDDEAVGILAANTSIVSTGRLSPLSIGNRDALQALESSPSSPFGSVSGRSGTLAPLSGSKPSFLSENEGDEALKRGISNKPILEKLASPTSHDSSLSSLLKSTDEAPLALNEAIKFNGSSEGEESGAFFVNESENQALTPENAIDSENKDIVDRVTDELWSRLLKSELPGRFIEVERDLSPAPIKEEPSLIVDYAVDIPNISPEAEQKIRRSEFPALLAPSSFPSLTNIPEDEKRQMHMKLTNELDDLYDFDGDIKNVAVPKATLPSETKNAKSEAEIEVELAVYREEVEYQKAAARTTFWKNRSMVCYFLLSFIYCFILVPCL